MSLGTEALFEGMLNGGGAIVDEVKGQIALHANVDLEGLAKFHLTCSATAADNVQEFTTSNIKKVNVRATIDKECQAQFTPNTLDFEYAMTREEQAAAKKAAKASLPQAPEEEGDDNGGGSGGSDDPGVTE